MIPQHMSHPVDMGSLAEGGSIALLSVQDNAAQHFARRFVGQQGSDEYLQGLSEHDVAEARTLLESSGIPHETLIRSGDVAREIVAAAEEGKFDMIVLGSKGRSGLTDLLVGSVARRVCSSGRSSSTGRARGRSARPGATATSSRRRWPSRLRSVSTPRASCPHPTRSRRPRPPKAGLP